MPHAFPGNGISRRETKHPHKSDCRFAETARPPGTSTSKLSIMLGTQEKGRGPRPFSSRMVLARAAPKGRRCRGQTPKGTFRKHHLRVRPVLCFNRVSSSSGNGFVGSETLDCGEGATLLVPQPQPQAVAFAALTVPASSVGQSAPRRLSRPG